MSNLGEMILALDRLSSRTNENSSGAFTQVDRLTIDHLAAIPKENWTDPMKLAACKLQEKYSALLNENGGNHSLIEAPESTWFDGLTIANEPNITAKPDGFSIRFPFNSALNQAIKKVPGCIWKTTAWFVPLKLESATTLIRTAQNHALTVSTDAQDILLSLQAAAEAEYQIFDLARQSFFDLITRPGALLTEETPEMLAEIFRQATQIPIDIHQQRHFISYFVDIKMQMQMAGVKMIDRTVSYPRAETLAGYAAISKHIGRRLMETRYIPLAKSLRKFSTDGNLKNSVDKTLAVKLAKLDSWLLWQAHIAWRLLMSSTSQNLEEPPKTTIPAPCRAEFGQEGVVLYFPYDPELVKTIKEIPGRTSESDPIWHWIIPLNQRSALPLASLLVDYQFDFPEDVYSAMRAAVSEAPNALV